MANSHEPPQSPLHKVPSPWIVFCSTLTLFIGLNLWMLYDTLGAYQTDLSEQAGWPFVFYSRGGLAGVTSFHPEYLIADILIAIGASVGMTYLMRNGWREFWRQIRTGGMNLSDEQSVDRDSD